MNSLSGLCWLVLVWYFPEPNLAGEVGQLFILSDLVLCLLMHLFYDFKLSRILADIDEVLSNCTDDLSYPWKHKLRWVEHYTVISCFERHPIMFHQNESCKFINIHMYLHYSHIITSFLGIC